MTNKYGLNIAKILLYSNLHVRHVPYTIAIISGIIDICPVISRHLELFNRYLNLKTIPANLLVNSHSSDADNYCILTDILPGRNPD